MARFAVLLVVVLASCGRVGFEPTPEDGSDATSSPACGDGFVDPVEECDDANVEDGDACTSTCRLADQGAGGGSCATARGLELAPIANGRLAAAGAGTTIGGADTIRSSCIPAIASPEAIYELVVPASGTLEIVVQPSASDRGDALLVVYSEPASGGGCGAATAEVACVDALGSIGRERSTFAAAPGTYFIAIELLRDSDPAAPGAQYELGVTLTP